MWASRPIKMTEAKVHIDPIMIMLFMFGDDIFMNLKERFLQLVDTSQLMFVSYFDKHPIGFFYR